MASTRPIWRTVAGRPSIISSSGLERERERALSERNIQIEANKLTHEYGPSQMNARMLCFGTWKYWFLESGGYEMDEMMRTRTIRLFQKRVYLIEIL